MLVTLLSYVRDRPVLPCLLPLRSNGLLHHVARLREQRPEPAHLHDLQPRLQEGIQEVVAHSLNSCAGNACLLLLRNCGKQDLPPRVPQNTLIETTGDPRPRLGLAVEEDEKEDWSSAEFFQERKRHYTIPTDFFGTKNRRSNSWRILQGSSYERNRGREGKKCKKFIFRVYWKRRDMVGVNSGLFTSVHFRRNEEN